jgi:dTDP-4-dehydrorhamnose reductase
LTTRVLLTGASGQLGWELRRCLVGLAHVVAPARHELDLASGDSLRRRVLDVRPDLVINAAGYTAVERAEEDEALACRINGEVVGMLADTCQSINAAMLHFSTDYVFPGTGETPWQPGDGTAPLSAYGRSKLAGEQALQQRKVPSWTIRTSWLYSARGTNFVLTLLGLLQQQPAVRVVNDQIGAPTWARSLAQATVAALMPALSGRVPVREHIGSTQGLYHLACRGETTWFGLAERLRDRLLCFAPPLALAAVLPVTSEQYGGKARRPANSRLDCSLFEKTFGVAIPHWELALDLCLEDIFACAGPAARLAPGAQPLPIARI